MCRFLLIRHGKRLIALNVEKSAGIDLCQADFQKECLMGNFVRCVYCQCEQEGEMAKTNIIVPEGVQTDYSSVIVSYSNGIDSTGALYWTLQEFPKEKIFLLYCDTGLEYPENIKMFYQTSKYIGVKPVLLQHQKGFLNLLLEERFKWPDMKNRWCTAYLKTGVTDHWIRTHRDILGNKCLFVSGERRDESKCRAKLPEIEYHSTTLKTKRVADFTCHWYRPCLDFEKGKMFEWGKDLGMEPHFCYEYLDRCSCMACMFMSDKHAVENMKRYPEQIAPYIQAEIKLAHTWKKNKGLAELWEQCKDIDDVEES